MTCIVVMSNPYTGTGMASIGERFWRFLWLLRLLCQDISVSLSLSLDKFMISSINILTTFFLFLFLFLPRSWLLRSQPTTECMDETQQVRIYYR